MASKASGTGKKAGSGTAAGETAAPARTAPLTKEVRRTVYGAANGNCHVCDTHCDPLSSDWHVITDSGKRFMLCTECKRQQGNGGLEELRAALAPRLREARALVARYGHLRGASEAEQNADARTRIEFEGEPDDSPPSGAGAVQPGTEAPPAEPTTQKTDVAA